MEKYQKVRINLESTSRFMIRAKTGLIQAGFIEGTGRVCKSEKIESSTGLVSSGLGSDGLTQNKERHL